MAYHSTSEKLRILVSRIFVIFLLIIILFSDSHWQFHELIDTLIFAAGCVLASIGAMGRLWCSLYISGYKNDVLITTGPYSMSRHPLYFFSLIGALGVAFTTETLLIPLIVLIVFISCYPSIILGEEKRLLSIHGEKFKQYCRRTPAIFPKLSLYEEPETYVVNPKIFKKSIFSALWFIWFIAILEIVETFHEVGILPVYFRLY
ncbi:MAG: isoprenylcysteine carboxylmethyltransferase family protein [Phycisphaerae bacterium]|nr:isoprenylcysteine carboxylmethyltransferase family protein [Phycisphaerae bacterium]